MILLVTVVFFIPPEHCTVRPPNADGGDNLRISANVLNKQAVGGLPTKGLCRGGE